MADIDNARVNPDTMQRETIFREHVRNLLDLDPFTRDQKIYDELKRLKALEAAAKR